MRASGRSTKAPIRFEGDIPTRSPRKGVSRRTPKAFKQFPPGSPFRSGYSAAVPSTSRTIRPDVSEIITSEDNIDDNIDDGI